MAQRIKLFQVEGSIYCFGLFVGFDYSKNTKTYHQNYHFKSLCETFLMLALPGGCIKKTL